MKLTFYGHAALQIQTGDATVLVDPFISGNPLAEGVVKADDLEPDAILLTHAHGDHWGDTPSIAKRTGAVVVANFEITQYLTRHTGHDNVVAMNAGGAWEFDWGTVKQTFARHSSSFPDGTYGGNPNGYLIQAEGHTLYVLGDTSPFAEMAWIGEDYDIDVALVPIGDCFTMGPRDSLRAIKMIRPTMSVPVHYNTFPAIEVDVNAWARVMSENGFVAHVLAPGETLDL